jgi:hypothetical protein
VALEEELLADQKECAEHVMLVDLGRNDVGKVCKGEGGGGARCCLGGVLIVLTSKEHVWPASEDGRCRGDLGEKRMC